MATRVAATSAANKVYVTDANGNQTTDDRVITRNGLTHVPGNWVDFTDEEKEANYPFTCKVTYGSFPGIHTAKTVILNYHQFLAKYGIVLATTLDGDFMTFYAVRKP